MALKESTTFTLSISKLVSIIFIVIGASFTVGKLYQDMMLDKQQQQDQAKEIQDIKEVIIKVDTKLSSLSENQEKTTKDVSALQQHTHTMNAEIQLISSFVKDDMKRK